LIRLGILCPTAGHRRSALRPAAGAPGDLVQIVTGYGPAGHALPAAPLSPLLGKSLKLL